MATLERSTAVIPRGVGGKDYSRGVEIYTTTPELLFHEGFEELPLKFAPTGSAGSTVTRDTTVAWKGGASLRFTMGAAPAWARYTAYFGIVRTKKLLLDLAVALPPTTAYVILGLSLYDGVNRTECWVAYGGVTGWWYLDSGGVYRQVTDGLQPLRRDNQTFHRFRAAVDLELGEYLYVQGNEKILYLTGIAGRKVLDPLAPHARVVIDCTSSSPGEYYNVDEVRVSELT